MNGVSPVCPKISYLIPDSDMSAPPHCPITKHRQLPMAPSPAVSGVGLQELESTKAVPELIIIQQSSPQSSELHLHCL